MSNASCLLMFHAFLIIHGKILKMMETKSVKMNININDSVDILLNITKMIIEEGSLIVNLVNVEEREIVFRPTLKSRSF